VNAPQVDQFAAAVEDQEAHRAVNPLRIDEVRHSPPREVAVSWELRALGVSAEPFDVRRPRASLHEREAGRASPLETLEHGPEVLREALLLVRERKAKGKG